MGPQRVLQAVAVVALAAHTAAAAPDRNHERLAVIDLGPAPAQGEGERGVRQRLAGAVVAAGFDPVIGEGIEDALAGVSADRDAIQLAQTMAEAQRAFGALDCTAAIKAAQAALGIAAARQAAGLAAPELARALTYMLLCADRSGDIDTAMLAATRLRKVGVTANVPADVLSKYPEVDTIVDRELVPLEISADVTGAAIWIDFAPAGTAPANVLVPAGDHLIAAAKGTRRGWASGTAVRTQRELEIPTHETAGTHAAVAARVASWNGKLPAPDELGWVLGRVRARIALVRHGDTLEVWGRAGRAEAPRRLGGEDGIGKLAELDRLLALATDRAQTWNDRAPDPDRPLLVEDPRERAAGRDRRDEPTRWWVYASIIGAVVAAGAIVYVNDAGADRQRVELHFPRVQP